MESHRETTQHKRAAGAHEKTEMTTRETINSMEAAVYSLAPDVRVHMISVLGRCFRSEGSRTRVGGRRGGCDGRYIAFVLAETLQHAINFPRLWRVGTHSAVPTRRPPRHDIRRV